MSAPDFHNVGKSLIIIHKALSRSLDMAVESSQGDVLKPELREGYQKYIQALVSLLDAHHLGEEEIAFPFLRKIIPNGPFDQLISHHRRIAVQLELLKAWLASGASAWEGPEFAKLNQALVGLNSIWVTHVGLEEDTMGPDAVGQLLTPEESDSLDKQLSAHGQQHALPGELVIPFLLYNLPLKDRAAFSQTLPPVVVEQLIAHAWAPAWQPMRPFLLQ